ncbi:MAG: hypothetical protein JWR09_1238 [Mucilaginibacter sp.]|nr:hypothetical protein [Mucilaginibacter sp.]
MNNLDRNLVSLNAEFHDKGKAARGLKNLTDNFIVPGKDEDLVHLLRFHIPEGVRGQELVARFEIDALIEFYNLLLIAALAGYIPGGLSDDLKEEIIFILNHPPVKQYYNVNYPYRMTEFTLKYVQEHMYFMQEANVETISVFNEFVSLNRLLKRDKDLERFLGMLDDVRYDGDTINEVNEILSSFELLNKAIISKDKSEEERVVWGFIKYTAFLSQLKELLISTEEYPLLQSSLWMFHGYYFDRMNKKMNAFLDKSFNNLEKALNSPQVFSMISEQLFNENDADSFANINLEDFATSAVMQAREDVNFVLDKKWGIALKEYFSDSFAKAEIEDVYGKKYEWDVFLSNSPKDRPFVRNLVKSLSSRGITCWYDEEQIQSGESFSAKISEGLKKSNVILACVSANTLKSEWASYELNNQVAESISDNRKQPIITLILDNTEIKDLPEFLIRDSSIKYTSEPDYEQLLNSLSQGK